jgi:hypothetical protein
MMPDSKLLVPVPSGVGLRRWSLLELDFANCVVTASSGTTIDKSDWDFILKVCMIMRDTDKHSINVTRLDIG